MSGENIGGQRAGGTFVSARVPAPDDVTPPHVDPLRGRRGQTIASGPHRVIPRRQTGELSPYLPRELAPGTVLADRYELVRKLGAGGMGDVFLGRHTGLDRMVAVKVLGLEFTRKKDLVRRFITEARAASMIRHDHVVDITDFGHTEDGVPFFAMELLDGEDLADTLKREGTVGWERARGIVIQVLLALEAAHEHGVIHRDIKPSNCFRLDLRGNPDYIKVLDFGIAKIKSGSDDDSGQVKTGTGVVMGTTDYMSPEQAQGIALDRRTDLYSVGVILFQMLTGKLLFVADGVLGALIRRVSEDPPSPRDLAPEMDIPDALDRVVVKSLAREPEDRYQNAREFIEALEGIEETALVLQPQQSSARARVGVVALLGTLTACTIAGGMWFNARNNTQEPPVVVAQDHATVTTTPATTTGAPPPATGTQTTTSTSVTGSTGTPAADTSAETQPATTDATTGGSGQTGGTAGTTTASDSEGKTTGDSGSSTGTTGQAAASTGATDNPPQKPAQLPARPSERTIRQRLRKAETKARKRCKNLGTFNGMKVRVELTIEPSGKVSSSKVQAPYGTMPLGRCLDGITRAVRFPGSRQGTDTVFKYTF